MLHKKDRLFARADAILEGRENGLGVPILWHLALRKYGPAMLSLASRATATGVYSELGRMSNAYSPLGLMHRAYRLGELNAAQNLAMTYFYVGNLAMYRHWMRKAASAGDTDAAQELGRFETRQPYNLAKRLRRLRPVRRDGS
jgi:hypothetical protein